MESRLADGEGKILKGKVHSCSLEGDEASPLALLTGKKCPKKAESIALVPTSREAAEQVVWTLTFERPLRDYFKKPTTP